MNESLEKKENLIIVVDVQKTPEKENSTIFEVSPPLLQSSPVNLVFKDICYSTSSIYFNKECLKFKGFPLKFKKNIILNHVSGYIKPGELVALMGGSGAGKTTLLDILSGIPKRGNLTGKVLINNRDIKHYRSSIGYVSQTDYLMGTQTVKEALEFYISLKSPLSRSRKEKERVVNDVLEILDLSKIKNNLIGTEKRRGVSGGEKKRVSIGCELVTDPSIIFLDEPTTGLDAFSSLSVVDALKKLSLKGTTIVCTIHQPRPLIFEKFDKVIMLSKGSVSFFGSPKECPSFLKSAGFETNDNIADAMMDVISFESGNEKGKNLLAQNFGGKKTESISKIFEEKKLLINEEIEEIKGVDTEKMKTQTGAPIGLFLLLKRMIKNDIRDPSQIIGQICSKIFFGLLIGSIFFNLKNTQQGIRDASGVIFFMVTSEAMSMMDYMVLFIEERVLMRRESNKGLYTTASYFFANLIHSIPLLILYSTIYVAIAYPMLGLRSGFIYWFVMWSVLVLLIFVSQGLFYSIASVSPNTTIAQIVAPTVIVVLMIFTGFFILKDNIIGFWLWAYYVSFLRYAFELIMQSQFTNVALVCTPNELVGDICPFTNGNQFLNSLQIESPIIVDYFVLLGFLIAFYVFVFFALHIFHREKR